MRVANTKRVTFKGAVMNEYYPYLVNELVRLFVFVRSDTGFEYVRIVVVSSLVSS